MLATRSEIHSPFGSISSTNFHTVQNFERINSFRSVHFVRIDHVYPSTSHFGAVKHVFTFWFSAAQNDYHLVHCCALNEIARPNLAPNTEGKERINCNLLYRSLSHFSKLVHYFSSSFPIPKKRVECQTDERAMHEWKRNSTAAADSVQRRWEFAKICRRGKKSISSSYSQPTVSQSSRTRTRNWGKIGASTCFSFRMVCRNTPTEKYEFD